MTAQMVLRDARRSLRNGADTFGGMTRGVVVWRNIDGALVASSFTFHGDV